MDSDQTNRSQSEAHGLCTCGGSSQNREPITRALDPRSAPPPRALAHRSRERVQRSTEAAGLGGGNDPLEQTMVTKFPSWAMRRLIAAGDLAGVQRAVQENPAKLDAPVTRWNDTPLTWSLNPKSGPQPVIAKWLIERGAGLDLQDHVGWSALRFACQHKQLDMAELLIHRGADLDLQCIDGWSALMSVCKYGPPELGHLLVHHGANLDLQTEKGETALMFACSYEQPEIAQLLIHRGARLNLQNNDGETALLFACMKGQLETAQLLIYHGAGMDVRRTK